MGGQHQRGLHVHVGREQSSSVLLPLFAALLLHMSFPCVATSIVAHVIAYEAITAEHKEREMGLVGL
jgi:hypothetical protein